MKITAAIQRWWTGQQGIAGGSTPSRGKGGRHSRVTVASRRTPSHGSCREAPAGARNFRVSCRGRGPLSGEPSAEPPGSLARDASHVLRVHGGKSVSQVSRPGFVASDLS